MKKTWLQSSFLFYILTLIFIVFFSEDSQNLGLAGAITFLLICWLLLISSITFHPKYKIYFIKGKLIRLIEWILKITVFILVLVYALTNFSQLIALTIYSVVSLCDLVIMYLLSKQINKVSEIEATKYDEYYKKKIEEISIRGVTGPLIIMYSLILLIIINSLFYYHDIITGILFICFCLINIYILNFENRNQRKIGYENVSFLLGILLTQILINVLGESNLNENGLIQFLGIVIIVISLTPFNMEMKKFFQVK